MKILVLGGGSSPEREVSLRSAKTVTAALRTAGFDVMEADPARDPGLFDRLENTIVFPILHGAGGEDGTIQSLLEEKDIPYLGTMKDASAVCFDKAQTVDVYRKAGLPIAEGSVVSRGDYGDHPISLKPHVLKACHGGSSIGTYIVNDPSKIDDTKVSEVFQLDSSAILEELVEGTEITVAVVGDQALPVIEIQPPQGKEFDYENKYNGATAELCPPVSIDKSTQQQAQSLALEAHKVLGCRHLSRTDIIVRPSGEMVLLETNTIPGMTSQSLLPKAAAAAGMPMPALVRRFVDMVTSDYGLKGEG